MIETLISWLHTLSFMLLFASIFFELMVLRNPLGETQIRQLSIADAIYGITAITVLTTGLIRWFYLGKGSFYYTHNTILHIKLGIFIIVGLLSIKPTVAIVRWRKQLKQGKKMDTSNARNLFRFVLAEWILLLFLPLLASLMARGYGLNV
jgi:putative membrane protein